MSDALVPVLTRAGLAALANAEGTGLQATIDHVAVGLGALSGGARVGYVPLKAATALVAEVVRVPILTGARLDPAGFRVLAQIPQGPEYAIREVGFYLATGELFALWSSPDYPLGYVTPFADVDLALDILIEQIPTELLAITVLAPDIPDTTGVLAGLLRIDANQFSAALAAEVRVVDTYSRKV